MKMFYGSSRESIDNDWVQEKYERELDENLKENHKQAVIYHKNRSVEFKVIE